MKRAAIIASILFAVVVIVGGVIIYPHARYFLWEFDLDEDSFDPTAMKLIEDWSELTIPNGTKGIRFHYIPPVDPIFFAQLELPRDSRKGIEKQIRELANLDRFPDNFANDRCDWWPSSPPNLVLVKKTFSADRYLEAYLIEDSNRLILFLKCFTI